LDTTPNGTDFRVFLPVFTGPDKNEGSA
jgi:hypothetical protein